MAFPTTEDRIVAAETQLGTRLPAGYRIRLIAQNGGEIEADDDDWSVFPVFDSSDRKRASRSANHIVRETQQAATWPGFPKGAVAIASNGTGDLLVFLARDEHQLDGRVQCWSHETQECTPTELDFT
jgi:hypothetical protein